MLKKISIFICIFISNIFLIATTHAATREVGNETIKNVLLGITENEVLPAEDSGLSVLDTIFVWIKDSLTGLLLISAIGVFLFIGIRVVMARGNPDEFKKSITQLIYAIVGIFLVGLAWAAVTLVAGLNF